MSGSGLSAQLGIKAEATWGTPVTVDRFYEFSSESLLWSPTWVEGQGLRAGATYKRDTRTQQTRFTVSGDITMEHVFKGGMGLLWKHALGSGITVPTQIAATTAWKQAHHPKDKTGLGFTVQVGRPEPSGTVRAHTYEGVKVTGWEFSVSDQERAQLQLTCDGQDESTATGLAAATYDTGLETFVSKDSNQLLLGATIGVTANEFTVTGGTAPAGIVRSFTLRGENPMATERHGLGNSGVKSEQIENDIPTITGTLAAEYTQADYYTTFKAGTSTSLVLRLQRGDAGTGNPYELRFILPKIKLKSVPIPVGGPDIVAVSVEFEGYHDGTLAASFTGADAGASDVLEVRLVSTDVTLAD